MAIQINPYMFRAYDIRGVVDDDLTEETAVIIGKGIGTYLQQQGGNHLVVGRDNRPSSEKLKDSLVEGLRSTGCDVIGIGLSTSPMMYAAVLAWNMDGGVNVTASHNPPQYNGFKVVGREAWPVGGQDMENLRDVTMSDSFLTGKGRYSQRDFLTPYLEKIERTIQLSRPIKVAVDTGNGVAGITVPVMLKRLGCEVVELFTDLDGTFPHHVPNPEDEANLLELEQQVVQTGAELGFGIDGDGDRIGLVDEHGTYLEADYAIMLLARDFLGRHPGQNVLIDVKTSQNTIDDIRKHGGIPVMWKTGHSLVKQKMREDSIMLGGELSGHMFVFEDYYPVDDALFAVCRLLQFLSKDSKKPSEYFVDLPNRYSTRLIEVHCDDAVKFDIVERVKQAFLEKGYQVNTVDGARVSLPGGWGLVRASNTAANLTLRFEADSPDHLETIKGEVLETLHRFLPR
jgi:phosphomannomutase/phosphoglucomutase